MQTRLKANGKRLEPVRFEFFDEQAHRVALAGTFNNWNLDTTKLTRIAPGRWLRVLFLLPGRYEYCVAVDGLSVLDPAAGESVPNAYGCFNSVLTVSARTPSQTRNGRRRLPSLRHASTPRRPQLCREMETSLP